jgi:hypothetical protein
MEDLQQANSEAARAAGEAWVQQLVGVDRPVTDEERHQALGELFDRWFPEQTSQ